MTTMPKPVRLFHITAMDNLAAICEQGALYISFPRSCVGTRYFYPPRNGGYRFNSLR